MEDIRNKRYKKGLIKMKKALFLFWVILMVNCSGEVDLVVKTHFPRNIQISGELARRII